MICFTHSARVITAPFLRPPATDGTGLAYIIIFSQEIDRPNLDIKVFFEKMTHLVELVDGNPLRIHVLPSPSIKKYQELFRCQPQ